MAPQTARKPAIKRSGAKAPSVAVKPLPIASKTPASQVKTLTKKLRQVNPDTRRDAAKTPILSKEKIANKAVAATFKKTKLVRDSFTIPKDEYVALQNLKERAVRLTKPAKKGELLRAGLLALANMPDVDFLAILAAVPALKTGRPKGIKNSKK